ncbi:TPA: ABC transporter permease [Enterobacter roggenkampii]|nr:ABC transporter permease [Enterobacter roggenkampii]
MSSLGYWCELISVLTRKEINIRYKSSVLGYLWSVLHPLIFGLIYFVIFREIMRFPIANYPLFILSGLFPWQWVAAALSNAPAIFLANASIIRRVAFPHGALPVSLVLMEGIHFLCALPVIVLLIVFSGSWPSVCWVWGIPVLWAIQSALLAGITCTLAVITPFLRDLERFTALGVMALFYATPVLYPTQFVPARWAWLLWVNPFAPLIGAWRDLLMKGQLPIALLCIPVTAAIGSLLVGIWVLRKFSPTMAEVL